MTGISYERLAVIVICLGVIAALFVTCVLVLCCKLLYKMVSSLDIFFTCFADPSLRLSFSIFALVYEYSLHDAT